MDVRRGVLATVHNFATAVSPVLCSQTCTQQPQLVRMPQDKTGVMSYLMAQHGLSPYRTDDQGRTALMHAAAGAAVQVRMSARIH